MRAMILEGVGQPLVLRDVPTPQPKPHQVRIKVRSCGVCRTDLHIVDGELIRPKLPLILGHQVVGVVDMLGTKVTNFKLGDRVGAPWLGLCCQHCEYCLAGKENLCDAAIFTGYMQDGGFAEYCVADSNFVFPLPDMYDDLHAAPLLCAGLIGYRAYRLVEPKKTIGFYGFGSSAHLLIQIAKQLGQDVYVFTRPGDAETQKFALSFGAKWAAGSNEAPPIQLDAAIIFAPVGALYVQALKAVKKGGKVISAGIHMSDIPTFPYALLWEERTLTSVANLTRRDGLEFMQLVQKWPLDVKVVSFALEEANQALAAIKEGTLVGSAVLIIK